MTIFNALHTLDEVAESLKKDKRWLRAYLNRHKTDRSGEPLYLKAGRTILLNDRDINRLLHMLEDTQRPIASRWLQDATNMLPSFGPESEGVVYFVRGGDYIKIGYSTKWRGRMAALQTASPVPLELLHVEPGNVAKERAYHRHFKHLHSQGEWFRASCELLSYIEMLGRKRS